MTRLSTSRVSTSLELAVVRGRVRLSDRGLSTASPFDRQDLLDDFVRREIAFPAVKAARAKFAAVGAADLGGDAERMAVAGVAVKRGIGGDQNAFDERMVVQPPEKFLRGVVCALFADEFERLERKVFLQFFAERLGQVRHRFPARDAMDIKPFEQLGHAILGLFPGGELRFQFLARQRFDVRQHARNLTGAGRETKTLRACPVNGMQIEVAV